MRWMDPPEPRPDLSASQAAQLLRDRRLGAALIERAAIAAARERAGLDPNGDQAAKLRRAVRAQRDPRPLAPSESTAA